MRIHVNRQEERIMMRHDVHRGVVLAITVALFMSSLFVGIALMPSAAASTLFVGGGGPGNYTTIQSAVENASAGSIVYVYPGTYVESVLVDKPISIIGEDREAVVIDGNGSPGAIRITSDWVNVTGVNVTNSDPMGTGMRLDQVQYCHVWDILAQGSRTGIFALDSDDSTFEGNYVSSNTFYGIALGTAYRNVVSNNTASYNQQAGIYLSASVNTIIEGNYLGVNERGIWLENSHFNGIRNNTLYENGKGMEVVVVAQNNTIYHNNFLDNTEQAMDDAGWNEWDNGYPSGGNYWSDYSGVDDMSGVSQDQPGSDGIGDERHDITGGLSQDRYPLMDIFIPTTPTAPSAPRNLTAAAGEEQVTLNWQTPTQDGGSTITSYIIYRGTTPGGETFLTEVGDVLTHTDASLTAGQTHYYTVSAKNAIGEGPLSNEANATPTAPANQLPECAISAPAASGTVSGMVNITGTASDPDGTVDSVEVRIDDGVWQQATGTTSWTFEWNTMEISDGSHTIRARSYDEMNYSQEVSVTVTVDNAEEPPPGDESIFSQAWFWVAILGIILVIGVLLVVLMRRRGGETERLEPEETG
jgi:parallel beta-helix repeat protein